MASAVVASIALGRPPLRLARRVNRLNFRLYSRLSALENKTFLWLALALDRLELVLLNLFINSLADHLIQLRHKSTSSLVGLLRGEQNGTTKTAMDQINVRKR